MENPNLFTSEDSASIKGKISSPSQNDSQIKRDHESIDDFEHLEPDVSPIKEQASKLISELEFNVSKETDLLSKFNNNSTSKADDNNSDVLFDPLSQKPKSTTDFGAEIPSVGSAKFTDSLRDPLLNFGTTDISFDNKKLDTSSKLTSDVSKFLEAETMGFAPPAAIKDPLSSFDKHSTIGDGILNEKELFSDKSFGNKDISEIEPVKGIQKEPEFVKPLTPEPIKAPTPEPVKAPTPEPVKAPTPEPIKAPTPEPVKALIPEPVKAPMPEPVKAPTPEPAKIPTPEPLKAPTPEPIKEPTPEPSRTPTPELKKSPTPEPVKVPTPEAIKPPTPEPVKVPEPEPIKKTETSVKKEPEVPSKKPEIVTKSETAEKKKPIHDEFSDIIEPDKVLRSIGFVEALVYWRDPKKSGAVFGTILVILLSLTYFSLISVVAYLSLLVLAGTIAFRIYKTVLQAIQKTSDGHPFKEYLEAELSLPQEKVREITDTAVAYINAIVNELRRLFLVEDLIDSLRFGIELWCLTWVGSIFNGMTLVIIAFIGLFTLPKVYENNKTQIDANLAVVQSKLAEITSKIKASLPIGKKEAEKEKDQ